MFRVYLVLISLSIIIGSLYGAKRYYEWTTATIESLRVDKALLEDVVQANEDTITQLEADMEKTAELNRNLTRKLQASQVHLDALRKRFSQIDLAMEAINDPAGLEVRINNAVTKLIGRIERETSPRTGTPDANSVQQPETGTENNNQD